MKISTTFRVFAFLIAVLICSMPVITFAQQNPIKTKAEIETEAKLQAIIDAENDANKTVWFMRGCFLNILGVALARRTKAPVPAGRLVGKSLTYIVAYTSAYQTRRTEIQVESTLLGCILGPLCCVVACVVGVYLLGHTIDDGGTFTSSSGSGGGGGSGGGSWCSPLFF